MSAALLSICVLALATLVGPVGAVESPVHLIRFGDHLFSEGDYYRAVTEYKRFLFEHGDDETAPEVQFRVALAHLNGGKPDAAVRLFGDVASKYAGSDVGRRSEIMAAESLFTLREFGQAAERLDAYIVRNPTDLRLDDIRLSAGWCRLSAGDVVLAKDVFESIPDDSALAARARQLSRDVDAYADIEHKSPAVSAALSAVLPGAGHLYVARPRDALISFTINALSLWGCISAFENDEEVAGSLLAILESGWYLGSIYSATSSAHKFNRRTDRQFLRNMELKYDLSIAKDSDKNVVPLLGVGIQY